MGKTIREQAASALDIPPEVAYHAPKLIISDNTQLKAINHRGVVIYEGSRIQFRTVRGLVDVFGRNLELEQLTDEYLLISGEIARVEVEDAHES